MKWWMLFCTSWVCVVLLDLSGVLRDIGYFTFMQVCFGVAVLRDEIRKGPKP